MKENEFVIYKTWKSEYKLVIGMLLGMFLSVFLSSKFPQTVVVGNLFNIGSESVNLYLPVFWLIPCGFFLYALIRIYNVKYCLTSKGLEMTVGILSARKRSVKIRYEDIRSVETMQTILERILNIGSVEVGTSATDAIEIVFEGVDAPQEIQALVQKEKGRRLSLSKGNNGFNTSNE